MTENSSPPFEVEGVAEVQAAAEGVTLTDQVEFMGEKYRMSDKLGTVPLMKFARALRGAESARTEGQQVRSGMEAMAAMYEMVRDCIHPDDWDRFENDAIAKKAEQEDLDKVIRQVVEATTARPTTPR